MEKRDENLFIEFQKTKNTKKNIFFFRLEQSVHSRQTDGNRHYAEVGVYVVHTPQRMERPRAGRGVCGTAGGLNEGLIAGCLSA